MITMGSPIPTEGQSVGDGGNRQMPEDHVWQVLAGLNGLRSTLLMRDRAGTVHGTTLVVGVDNLQRQLLLDAQEQANNEFPVGEPIVAMVVHNGQTIIATTRRLFRLTERGVEPLRFVEVEP